MALYQPPQLLHSFGFCPEMIQIQGMTSLMHFEDDPISLEVRKNDVKMFR
jgi:hypothetical protein